MLVTVVFVGVVFALVLPRVAGYGQAWRAIRHLSLGWIAVLLGAVLLNLATFPLPWLSVVPRLRFFGALLLTQASTAIISVVPGGAPLGMGITFAILRWFGVDASSAGLAVAVTGVWSQVSTFLFPVAALALLAGTGNVSASLVWVAAAGSLLAGVVCVVVGYALFRERGARLLGRLVMSAATFGRSFTRRGPLRWDLESVARLRASGVELLRRRWVSLTVTTVVNQLTGFLVFDLALRSVGIGLGSLSVVESFAAWSLGRLIGSLPLTPGGIGFVELGLIGSLVGFGGPHGKVVAGVLLYRAVSVVPTLALGSMAALWWRTRPGARGRAEAGS